MQRIARREVLLVVLVVLGIGLISLGWVITSKLTAEPAQRPGSGQVVQLVDLPASSSVPTSTSGPASTTADTSTSGPVVAAEPGAQQPPAQQRQAQQGQVQQQADPVEPTDQPGTTLTTTPPASPPTPTHEPMPWCYNKAEGVWYSGRGEGCHPDSVDFVEWRY